MPSLDDTKTEAKQATDSIDDDWGILTGGESSTEVSTDKEPEVPATEAVTPEAEMPEAEPEAEAEAEGGGEPSPETTEPEKPKPAAGRKSPPKKLIDIDSIETSPFVGSGATDYPRLSEGAAILRAIGEVFLFIGRLVDVDCKNHARKSAPSCTSQGNAITEPIERIPSRIRILIDSIGDVDAEEFRKGDEFAVDFVHKSGTIFVVTDIDGGMGFDPKEFEVIAWQGESEIDWRDVLLNDAGAPMAVCLGRSKINTIGDLMDYGEGDEQFEVLDGVGKKKADKIRNWIQQYFHENPRHLAEHTSTDE